MYMKLYINLDKFLVIQMVNLGNTFKSIYCLKIKLYLIIVIAYIPAINKYQSLVRFVIL